MAVKPHPLDPHSAATPRCYREAFLHARSLSQVSCTLDFGPGLATLPLLESSAVQPDTIELGASSQGSSLQDPSLLTSGKADVIFTFSGTRLELMLTFTSPQILNRLVLELDDHEGLTLSLLASSPDGSLYEDLLADGGASELALDATSGKHSGEVILDFAPRSVARLRLVLEDRVGAEQIGLRSLACFRHTYGRNGQLTTLPIAAPSGKVRFLTHQVAFAPYTSITHLLSSDGLSYRVITPGDILELASPYWYRALLMRDDAAFARQASPLSEPGPSPYYQLEGMTTTPLGNSLIERVITLVNVSGPIRFREQPIASTFTVQEGASYLEPGAYTFSDGVLSFPAVKSSIIVRYQTSELGPASVGPCSRAGEQGQPSMRWARAHSSLLPLNTRCHPRAGQNARFATHCHQRCQGRHEPDHQQSLTADRRLAPGSSTAAWWPSPKMKRG